jgi:hypothetical protein
LPGQAIIDERDIPDITEHMLPMANTEKIDATEPTEPMDRIDPAEPIDKIEPADPIDRTEPADLMLCTEPAEPPGRRDVTPAFSQPGAAGDRGDAPMLLTAGPGGRASG